MTHKIMADGKKKPNLRKVFKRETVEEVRYEKDAQSDSSDTKSDTSVKSGRDLSDQNSSSTKSLSLQTSENNAQSSGHSTDIKSTPKTSVEKASTDSTSSTSSASSASPSEPSYNDVKDTIQKIPLVIKDEKEQVITANVPIIPVNVTKTTPLIDVSKSKRKSSPKNVKSKFRQMQEQEAQKLHPISAMDGTNYTKRKKLTPVVNKKTQVSDVMGSSEAGIFAARRDKVESVLGSGNYSIVYKITSAHGNQEMAVKVIKEATISKHYKDVFMKKELSIIQELKHENIIKIYEIIFDRKSKRNDFNVLIFMEYASHGTMAEYLRERGSLPEFMCRAFFQQILSGLSYLHYNRITAHRDIKLENILLTVKDVPKIADFSYAIKYPNDHRPHLATEFCGTSIYLSPELMELTLKLRKSYDPFKSDIWSLGICLFIMLNDKLPFQKFDTNLTGDVQDVLQKMKHRHYKYSKRRINQITPEAKNIIWMQLDPSSATRADCRQLYKHHWFKSTRV